MTTNDTKHRVAEVAELEENPKRIEVEGKKYLLAKSNGGVMGFKNVCPHQHGPIAEGKLDLEKGTVICPWHGWEYELDSGKNVYETGVADNLPQVKTSVEDGDVYLHL